MQATIPYEVDLWHFSLLKCPLWYESLNVKVPFHFLFVFAQHLLIASLILKPEHLLTCFEVQTCRNLKMTRCQTNTQRLACVTWQFCRARKQVKVGKGTWFLFLSRLCCSAMQGLLATPGFSTTYGEKKYREVSKSYSTTSFSALSMAVTQGLAGSTDFKEGCWRLERSAGEG